MTALAPNVITANTCMYDYFNEIHCRKILVPLYCWSAYNKITIKRRFRFRESIYMTFHVRTRPRHNSQKQQQQQQQQHAMVTNTSTTPASTALNKRLYEMHSDRRFHHFFEMQLFFGVCHKTISSPSLVAIFATNTSNTATSPTPRRAFRFSISLVQYKTTSNGRKK